MADNTGSRFARDEAILKPLLESVFCSFIEDGTIEVGDRNSSDIIAEFNNNITQALSRGATFDFYPHVDHRDDLRTQAASESTDTGNHYIAVTLYVIWVEHFINGMLDLQFVRLGYDWGFTKPLIRELKLTTKATSLWHIAKLPPLPEKHLKNLNTAIELRNYFVHYKWASVPSADAEREQKRLSDAVRHMEDLANFLTELENQVLWCGRKEEIVRLFRSSLDERRRKVGPPDFPG